MFSQILLRKVLAILVWAMIYTFQEIYAWCHWENEKSEILGIVNGTLQGLMASPFLWAMYCDPLVARLCVLGVGCHVGGVWMEIKRFSDDVAFLAPNRRAMELVLCKAEAYAQ